MWDLPPTLEILNFSKNLLRKLNPEVVKKLTNLATLDVSHNDLESLEHIHHMRKLKRLLANDNQVKTLSHLSNAHSLVEIDLENNPLDSSL